MTEWESEGCEGSIKRHAIHLQSDTYQQERREERGRETNKTEQQCPSFPYLPPLPRFLPFRTFPAGNTRFTKFDRNK